MCFECVQFQREIRKISGVVSPVVKILGNWSFQVVDLQMTARKCTKNYNPRVQPLYTWVITAIVHVL